MTDPFRLFRVQVRRLERLAPAFMRVTFTGRDLDDFADTGYDQRIKLVLPLPCHGLAPFPTGADWYTQWRRLPDQLRNPLRTYTVRAVRQSDREVDVDFVVHPLHDDAGPAARWLDEVAPGDEVALYGPNALHEGPPGGGIEFRLPADGGGVLLAGDETAVPAIASILARMPRDRDGEALLEVPGVADILPLDPPPGMKVTWLPRDGAAHGSLLLPAVRDAAERLLLGGEDLLSAAEFTDIDVDAEELWEVPEDAPAQVKAPPYVWLAGEAAVIRGLRRHLVAERGLDRRTVAFMGYWRMGRSEQYE